jgi:putative endonuclease
MTTKSEIGKIGEDLACKYLINKGHKIIERNHLKPWGEIDIVSRAPDKTLVFVEVKTVKTSDVDNLLVTPEDQMTKSKIIKLRRVVSTYAADHESEINENVGWRIDLLALTITSKDCLIKHYENVV